MRREQLEHIIRAACAITGAPEVVIIGSQAVLGQHPEAPPELCASIEADVFTLRDPADADLIEGSIGERSPFHVRLMFQERRSRERRSLPLPRTLLPSDGRGEPGRRSLLRRSRMRNELHQHC